MLKFYERDMASNTSKNVTTGTDANSKFKWSDDVIQRLYATLIRNSFLGGFNIFFENSIRFSNKYLRRKKARNFAKN